MGAYSSKEEDSTTPTPTPTPTPNIISRKQKKDQLCNERNLCDVSLNLVCVSGKCKEEGATGGNATGGNPCLAREATLFLGCGYAYGKFETRQSQCGQDGGTSKFIGDGIPNGDPCKLPRGSTFFNIFDNY